MIELRDTIISRDILKEEFVCNLSACKGECCIAGDSGAPLTQEEAKVLEENYSKIEPLLTIQGKTSIKEKGTSMEDFEGDLVTTLVGEKGMCAYTVFDENDTAQCSIEIAKNKGIIDFDKPMSCYLYPIREKVYPEFTAINYDRWDICSDACSLGQELKVPVYKFLKEPLTKKFGKDWYNQLLEIAEDLEKQETKK